MTSPPALDGVGKMHKQAADSSRNDDKNRSLSGSVLFFVFFRKVSIGRIVPSKVEGEAGRWDRR